MHRLAPLLLVLSACVAATAQPAAPHDSHITVPPPPAGIAAARWEYFCLTSPSGRHLNEAGAQGWELVTAVPHGDDPLIPTWFYCFKRALPEVDVGAGVSGGGSPGSTALSRASLEAALASPATHLPDVRAVVHYEGTTAVGVRLHGIVDGSPLARLGLRERDVVTAIRGLPVRSLDDVRTALSEVAATLRVSLLRDRAPLDLVVTITP